MNTPSADELRLVLRVRRAAVAYTRALDQHSTGAADEVELAAKEDALFKAALLWARQAGTDR